MTQKVGKLWVTLLISRTGVSVVLFSEKEAVSNFFFEKETVAPKKLGTYGLDQTNECLFASYFVATSCPDRIRMFISMT